MTARLSDVSVRDQIVPISPGQTLFDVLPLLETKSIEVMVAPDQLLPGLKTATGVTPSLRDETSIRTLRDLLAEQDVRISALLLATDFSGDAADVHLRWAKRAIEAAATLQIPVVRIDPLTADRALPAAVVRDRFVAQTRRLLDQTTDTGVDVGMENHAHLFNDPNLLDEVLSAIDDPRFGLTLDTGNFFWWGHPISRVYELIERYAPRAKHTHVKNISYPPEMARQPREIGYEYKHYCGPLYEGALDLRRIVTILRDGGYKRDCCVEDESLFKAEEADRLNILRRDIQALRQALA